MTIKLKIPVESNGNLDTPGTLLHKMVEIRIDNFEDFKEDWVDAHFPRIFTVEQIKEIYNSLPKND